MRVLENNSTGLGLNNYMKMQDERPYSLYDNDILNPTNN